MKTTACVPICILVLATLACGKASRTEGGSAGEGGLGESGGTGDGNSGGSRSDGGSGAEPAAGSPATENCVPGRTPLRRLTVAEYDNTVREILGDTSAPGAHLVPDWAGPGFSNDADGYETRIVHVEGWLTASEALAASYRKLGKLALACAADGPECAAGFIEDMGKRLFRRPITSDEVANYLDTFAAGSSDGGTFEEGLEWVLGRMLQSPYFLYRVELESSGMPPDAVAPLDDYSIATRLSYFLWSSAPDAELLAVADAGQLSTPEGVTAQVQRMMVAPAFEATLRSFHSQWTRWDRIIGSVKTAETMPAWDESLQLAMVRESELFVKSIFDSGGSFEDLLTATHSFVNPSLAQFYGVAYPGTGTEFVEVEIPNRAGLLTLPAILAGVGAHSRDSSPVRRGAFIRQRLLCFEIPPEPPDVMTTFPVESQGTTRERTEAHSSDPACAGCHVYSDPLGFPLEHFDQLGRYRETEMGKPIDASGGLTRVPSRGDVFDPQLAPVDGAMDLAQQLAALPEARECMVRNWFRFAYGRRDESTDACTLASLVEHFDASGYKLHDLVAGIATNESFRRRVESTP